MNMRPGMRHWFMWREDHYVVAYGRDGAIASASVWMVPMGRCPW